MCNDSVNTITITGPEPSLAILKNIAIKRDVLIPQFMTSPLTLPYVFDLESLHPSPFDDEVVAQATEAKKGSYKKQKRQWHCDNWGTARTYIFEEKENIGGRYVVKFYTSFAPPLMAFHKISQDYPDLTFKIHFYIIEHDVRGTYVFKDGEHINARSSFNDKSDALFNKDPKMAPVMQGRFVEHR